MEAENWLVALGRAFEHQGVLVERLACEVLPNGTVIAREAETGLSFVVQPILGGAEAPTKPTTEEEVFVVGDGDADRFQEIYEAEDEWEASRLAMNLAQDLVGAEAASVILAFESKLMFVAASGPHSDTLLHVEMPLGTGVAGYSMERRRPVVLGDATADDRHFDGVDRLTGQNTREMACVPIAAGDQVYGVLELLNLPDLRRFSRDNLQQMSRVADALAIRLSG